MDRVRDEQGVTPADVGFDPTDPNFIEDPYPVLRALRELGPAVYYPQRDSWLLTRFADVHAALRHRGLGRIPVSGERGDPGDGGGTAPADQTEQRYPRWRESERWSLLNLEPPDHSRLRRLISAAFTARSVQQLRPECERLAAEVVDRALPADPSETFDLITRVAQPYSIAVICTLLGVPADAGPALLRWSHAIVKMYELHATDVERDRAENAAGEFLAFARALIADRRRDPGDDLISRLVATPAGTELSARESTTRSGQLSAEVSADCPAEWLTDDEIVCTLIVLLNAGHEATVNTLGNGMRAALTHPAEWRRLISGAVSPVAAVEEFIRWDAPLQLFERHVRDETVRLAGRTFHRGDRIGMLFGLANRDPARFTDPDAFDVGRADPGHLGFGGGIHFCIGAPLARLEVEVMLRTLIAAVPNLRLAAVPDLRLAAVPDSRLAAVPTYQPYFVIRGLTALHLRRA